MANLRLTHRNQGRLRWKDVEGLSMSVNVSVQGEMSSRGDERDERDGLKG